jgi:hypothetical protein
MASGNKAVYVLRPVSGTDLLKNRPMKIELVRANHYEGIWHFFAYRCFIIFTSFVQMPLIYFDSLPIMKSKKASMNRPKKNHLLSWLFTLIKLRTLLILIISFLACVLTIRYNVKLGRSTVLYSLVISFPLYFSIQAAFKRREKALEYLSMFRAGMQVSEQAFYQAKKLSAEASLEIKNTLEGLSRDVMMYLSTGRPESPLLYNRFEEVFLFMQVHKSDISTSVNMRILRHLERTYQAMVYLVSLTNHRTMIAVRKISYCFIMLFPVIEAPALYSIFGKEGHEWITYLLSALSSFLLISFYTMQEQIENPFDRDGIDDIHLDDFLLIAGKKYIPVRAESAGVKEEDSEKNEKDID